MIAQLHEAGSTHVAYNEVAEVRCTRGLSGGAMVVASADALGLDHSASASGSPTPRTRTT
eukprot:3674541-Prymnesium_polylepis.1